MAIWRIIDVFAKYDLNGTLRVTLKGAVQNAPMDATWSTARCAAMLQVFNLGRECYWDEDAGFTTVPGVETPPEGFAAGSVGCWDVSIPKAGNATVFLGIDNTDDALPTSGMSANTLGTLDVAEENLAAVVAILNSAYVRSTNNALLNTDYVQFLPER